MLTERQRVIHLALKEAAPGGACELSLRQLAGKVGCSVNTLRDELKRMAHQGIVETDSSNRYRTYFRVWDPIRQRTLIQLEHMLHTLENAPYYGEALLKAILDVTVADIPYIDNARPSFLINPLTGQTMEYDRYYESHQVAAEFHGPQHDGLTDLHATAAAARRQRARDLIKLGLSVENRVTVVVFRAAQLSIQGVITELAGHLPLRNLNPGEPRIKELERRCEEYRNRSVPKLRLKMAQED